MNKLVWSLSLWCLTLLSSAQAQTPAVAEQAAKGVIDGYVERGVLGITCLLLLLLLAIAGWVIRTQYRDNKEMVKTQAASLSEMQAWRQQVMAVAEAMKALQGAFEARGQAIVDLGYKDERLTEKVTHGFGNMAQSAEALLRLFEKNRDAIENLTRTVDRELGSSQRFGERGRS